MGLIDANQSLHLIKKYLPGSLIAGGSVAGLQHLAGMLHEMEKDKKEKRENDDVLTVEIPRVPKVAGVGDGLIRVLSQAEALALRDAQMQSLFRGGAAATASSSVVAPTVISPSSFSGRAARGVAASPVPPPLPPALPSGASGSSTPGVPTQVVSPAGGPPPANVSTPAATITSAAVPPWSTGKKLLVGGGVGAGGVAAAAYKNYNPLTGQPVVGGDPPNSPLDPGIIAAIIGGGTIGGYSLINHIIKERQKKNLQEQLDDSKKEYSQLLGASLLKGASADPAFPIINGICFSKIEKSRSQKEAAVSLAHLVGAPTLGFSVSAILAHRWMYERQKELEALHTQSKPSPPKQIKLVTAPEPNQEDEDGEKPLALNYEKEATAMPDWFNFFEKQTSEIPNELDAKQVQQQKDDDAKRQPKMTNVAPGTIQVLTKDGPVEIEAEDARSARILEKTSPRLTKLLAAFQSTPAELR